MTDLPASKSDPTAAIELIDVTKRYGSAVALDGVSMRIAEGEFFCLLGPSGCGKTTTLNLIGGFIPMSGGELRIQGVRVDDLPPHKRNVNTVFQSYALFPHMTVAQNVAFGLRMEGLGAGRAQDARRRVPGAGGSRGHGESLPDAALGRAAAARRPGTSALQAPGGAAARRAAGCAGPEAAAPDAERALADPPAGRHDLRVRDARPGGSVVDGDADRGHVAGPRRAAGDSPRDLLPPGEPLRGRLHRGIELPRRLDRC